MFRGVVVFHQNEFTLIHSWKYRHILHRTLCKAVSPQGPYLNSLLEQPVMLRLQGYNCFFLLRKQKAASS